MQSTENQSKIIQELTTRAGLTVTPPKGSDDWAIFVEAGFTLSMKNATDTLIPFSGSIVIGEPPRTRSPLPACRYRCHYGYIAGAAAEAIATTAAAFGFLTATVGNLSNSVLYELEPSGIKTLVDRSRAQYRAAAKQRTALKKRTISRPRCR